MAPRSIAYGLKFPYAPNEFVSYPIFLMTEEICIDFHYSD